MNIDINEIYEKFRKLEQVEALALGGSRASGNSDPKSDYDLYVYVTGDIDNDLRRDMLLPYCDAMEIGNHYWEFEDNVVLKDGVSMDIIYRKLDAMAKYVGVVVNEHLSMNGYTTCFWHNIRTCRIIFDKSGKLTELQEHCSCEYPKELKRNIIEKNMNLLSGKLPSYDKQVAKAFDRHDYVSINHRVAGFLESYFDVIFALNEMTHPGEKKLIQICKSQCKILPADFEKNISSLFQYMFMYDVSDILEKMAAELKKVVDINGI